MRGEADVEVRPDTRLQAGDEILLAGPTVAVIDAHPIIGPEIAGERVMSSVPGEVLDVLVASREIHGRTLGWRSSTGSGMMLEAYSCAP